MRTRLSIVRGLAASASVVACLMAAFSAAPFARTAASAPPLHAARYGHTATPLADGRILVAGGEDGTLLGASIEIYDSVAQTWTHGTPMPAARARHAATPLPDGRMLVTGGRSDEPTETRAHLYDPTADTWVAVATMLTPRYGHTAVLLADGTVLIAGGYTLNADGTAAAVAECEIYDPVLDRWTVTEPMTTSRAAHTATRLADGRVFVSGGYGAAGAEVSAEIFDPVARRWTPAAAAASARAEHTATWLPDGRVLLAGGYDRAGQPRADAELYDIVGNTWSPTASLTGPRAAHAAALLPSGGVLISGGYDGTSVTDHAEIWTAPPTPRPTTTAMTNASPATSVYGQLVTLTVRVGVDDGSVPEGAVEFFDNGVSLGSPVTLASGQASLVTASISVNNRLIAVYRPVGLFEPSNSDVFSYPVAKAAATSTLTLSKTPQQYSDLETFQATLAPAVPGVVSAGSVTFKVGTQEMGTAPLLLEGGVYRARLTAALVERVAGQMLPTTPMGRLTTAVFDAPNFQVANAMKALVITKEDGRAIYDGTLMASTAGLVSTDRAVVSLHAAVKDLTAADSGQDGNPGDVRLASATFYDRESGAALSPVLPVALVDPNDTSTGVAAYQWPVALGALDAYTFRVGVKLGNYYNRFSQTEDVLVTVVKPFSSGFLWGDGQIALATSSGLKAGKAGSTNDFGFAVKYSGNGTKPTGHFHTIVRSGANVYHVKGLTLTSLVIAGKTAVLKGRASIYDVTNGSFLIDTAATFEVSLSDDASGDGIAITVRNGAGALWFSSGVARQPLVAGDIKLP
jgi:hypothetical protein